MIRIYNQHIILTLAEYQELLARNKPFALEALEAADKHLRGYISNGDTPQDMANRVMQAAEQYVSAGLAVPGWISESADDLTDAVRTTAKWAERAREQDRRAERKEAATPPEGEKT